MRKIHICFIVYILVLTMAGCENYDKAIQGIDKGREFVDTAAKKMTETRKGAEKSIGKLFGKETGKSDEKNSESKEDQVNKKMEKD